MLTPVVIAYVLAALMQTPHFAGPGLGGYISMRAPAPPEAFRYGVSLYTTIWPLTEKPLSGFQIGLASTWILPDNAGIAYSLLPDSAPAHAFKNRGPSYSSVFQTIEGGLGFWANTQFGSPSAKFRMNGTPDGYGVEISSPGWGFGATKALDAEKMGIAQLSNRLLVPPDGMTFAPGSNGELFGYAWMALPLIPAKPAGDGRSVPTGNQSWTLFLNSKNFKGPVAFWIPATWSRLSETYKPATGRGLDVLPAVAAGGAIEINTVPSIAFGEFYKIPALQFPVDGDGRTILIHDLTYYSKGAMFNGVGNWLAGGAAPDGSFDSASSYTPSVQANPLALTQGNGDGQPGGGPPIHGLENSVRTCVIGGSTFGLQWDPSAQSPWEHGLKRGAFPEYFKHDGAQIKVAGADEVPEALRSASFPHANQGEVYASPASGVWRSPGPKAGPFEVKLTDGSTVVYSWYRFVDQPSMQRAGLTYAEKERLQKFVEKLHRSWKPNQQYMPANRMGTLAALDRALIVRPPKGLEVGYVPIAVRQFSSPRD